MKLTPCPTDPNVVDLEIDNSDLTLYTSCKRAFLYHVLQKKQFVKERTALFYGTVIHAVLAEHYKAQADDSALSFATAANIINDHFSKVTIPDDDFRTANAAEGLYAHYTDQYPVEDFEIARDDKNAPLIEVPFRRFLITIEVNGIKYRIHWCGRIDAIIIRNNQLLIMDHKTTSILGAGYFDEFFISQQMSGYCHWARSIGLPIYGYLINALCTRKPTKTGKAYETARQLFTVSDDSLDEWQENITQILVSLCEDLQNNRFPMETRWCKNKFGKCDFFDVCSAEPSSRHIILGSGLYEDHTWSPLNTQ